MNKIKKLLAASLVVLCLCGCGDKKAESEVSPQTSASEASGASEALSESSRIENEGTDLKEVFSKISESVELPSMNEFNDKLLQRYYGIDPLTVADYAGGTRSFSLRFPTNHRLNLSENHFRRDTTRSLGNRRITTPKKPKRSENVRFGFRGYMSR